MQRIMKNQISNNSVDKEIQSHNSKPSQQSQAQSQLLKDYQDIRIKSNSSSQASTIKKIPQVNIKNDKVQRPSSVNQRPSSIPKFTSSHSNEIQKITFNSNNRSQDDSYTVNSHINSVNSSYCIISNTSEQQNKSINVTKQLSYHQRGSSVQAIKQTNNTNIIPGVFSLKCGSPSSSLSTVQLGGNLSSDSAQFGLSTTQTVQTVSNQHSSISEAINIKHVSSVDLPSTKSQNTSDKLQQQQQNIIQQIIKQKCQQTSKIIKLKQKEAYGAEDDQDLGQREQDYSEHLESNICSTLEQNQIIVGSNGIKMNKVNINSQALSSNNVGVNNESEKIELNNSISSKLTSNSVTSRSQKNQLSASSDSLQDSKQESLNSNSALVSNSNNSSKVFKGSNNSSFIQITTKIQSVNADKGNLNEYIQSKEEINKSITLRTSKPRESYIQQSSRYPIKPYQPEEIKTLIISQEDAKVASGVVTQIKPNTELNEKQTSGKQTKKSNSRQCMQRRGNILSRSDADEFQLIEIQEDNTFQKQQSEDQKINPISSFENNGKVEKSRDDLNVNALTSANSNQKSTFQIKSNEEDIQNDQYQEYEDQEEEANDIEIKKQVEFLNSDDSENEDKMRIFNGKTNHQIYQNQKSIFQPIPVSQQQQQEQSQYHSNMFSFIDMSNSTTPQHTIQQQSFDPFIIPTTSSTPNLQQIDYINTKRVISGRPLSIDQQFPQYFVQQTQQQVINNPESCGSTFQFNDFQLQQSSQQQQQSSYVVYETPAHQHMQTIFNQSNSQHSPNMNQIIQLNQLHNSSPSVSNQQQQQQQGFQMFQQHHNMQQIMLQMQPLVQQHNLQVQHSQHSQVQPQQQQQQQQSQIYSNTNQISLDQQGQQQIFMSKVQRQNLSIQPNLSFSSNSNSTNHLQKLNCNLSQASTADSEMINTYRSGSSNGVQDKQQDMSQQLQQFLCSNQQAQQLSYLVQNQVQQQKQQQQQQQKQQQYPLNFFPHHSLPLQQVQQENKFFSQVNPNSQLIIQDNYHPSNPYNYSTIDQQQFQQSQQPAIAQNNYLLQFNQMYIPQNHSQMAPLNLSQMSPDKFNQGSHTFSNPTLLNSSDVSQVHKTPFGQINHLKPTHSKQLSCLQFGQFDQQNQMSMSSHQQQNIQQQKHYQNMSFHLKNHFNNSMNQGSFISNNSESNLSNSINMNINSLSTTQSKGKKKLEIKEETFKYDINLDKLEEDKRTSVYIQNIPNKYEQRDLYYTFEKHHKYINFFYLPIDFQNKCNVGYAFINFLKPEYIRDFFIEFNGKKWEKFNSEKICNLKYARIQGYQQLNEHFENSSVMKRKEMKFKPVFFHSDQSEIIENQTSIESNNQGQNQDDEFISNNNNLNHNNSSYHNSNQINYTSNNNNNNNNDHIYNYNNSQNYSNNNRYNNSNSIHQNRYRNSNIKNQQKIEQFYVKKQ